MAKESLSVEPPSRAVTLFRSMILPILIAGIIIGLPDIVRGARNRTDGHANTTDRGIDQDHAPTVLMAAREKAEETSASRKGTSPSDRNVERWRSLPSDEKKELRNRMDQWRNLSPQEQDAYRRRYEKLRELTPGQRKKVDQGLDQWDTLPPAEKEEIRQLFKE